MCQLANKQENIIFRENISIWIILKVTWHFWFERSMWDFHREREGQVTICSLIASTLWSMSAQKD